MYGIYINLGCRFEFRTQKLPYERISGNFSNFIDFGHQVRVCKKRSFLNISCNSKCMGFTSIWVADLNSERKNYPMKEFRAIFPISSILVIRSGYAKKDHFSILTVFQNIWDLHKFGLQIWIQNAKITLWKNFGQFFRFHRFWSSGPGMQKKDHFSILVVIQNIWDLHKFGLQIWIQNAKITLWKNFRQFFQFHRFSSSGPRMRKKIISQY